MLLGLGLVILLQSVVRMVVMEDEEGKSMGKVKHQLKLFVFSIIETVLAIQINIVSSVLSPSN
ncbi:ferrichrome transport system permease protein [Ktedonobacter racemifer DSM 44963]|uniref:Ferrichrome transport system permease protein n=1 Tax=Ktedonobacter racemifer DSM 44963 TaxID=485913 RepID=D6U045_KTERA|nr:ferrichrome transport system permease protein [Ktedonobacter racemifer DSM 44963]